MGNVVYVVTSFYFEDNNGLFGTYSDVKKARRAIENYLNDNENIFMWEDVGDYACQFSTVDGAEWALRFCIASLMTT